MTRPLWEPAPERRAATRMAQFHARAAARFGVGAGYEALHRWSVEQPAQFWEEVWRFCGVEARTPYRRVMDPDRMGLFSTCDPARAQGGGWFAGARLNYAEHLLRRRDLGPAIIAHTEDGARRTFSFAQLADAVARCQRGLRAAGVGAGDRVAGFLPNVPEAVIAMLAAAGLGAVWSSCSPDFGLQGVLDRFGQIAPKVLFACDGYHYHGKVFDTTERVAAIAARLHGIERLVLVQTIYVDFASKLPAAVRWDDFCDPAATAADLHFEPLPFDHPLFILYSSGTTGVPKCLVHGAGGTLLQHLKEHVLHCDLLPGDRLFYFTTCGWMMWNWLVGALATGATIVLYEGSPSHPDLGVLWRLAAAEGVTQFGTSPKFLGSCAKAGVEPRAAGDLIALRTLLSTGSPLSAELFRWVYAHVKDDLLLASISGGTDIISCFMLGNPTLPVYAGEIQCLGLGMDVQVFDAQGRALPAGHKGELVCASPFPSMPVSFWSDPGHALYARAYFEHFPGVWRHGDFIERTPAGGVIVYGRSDATLNPGGVRIGTAEIERLVEADPGVQDCLVVGREVGDDVEVVLFVVPARGTTFDAAFAQRLRRIIREGATPRHVPAHILPVTQVPRTISGKKVERAVADVLHGRAVANRDALANPEALDEYRGRL